MLHTLRFSLQNAIYFIMLPFLVPVLFTFYIQGVLKFECETLVPKVKHVCSHHICQHAINVSNPEHCTGFYSTTSAEHHTIKYVVCRINMFGPKC